NHRKRGRRGRGRHINSGHGVGAEDGRPHEALRLARRGGRRRSRRARRRGLRLPRSERRRQDHDPPPAMRAHRALLGTRRSRRLPPRPRRRPDPFDRRDPHRAARALRAAVRLGQPRLLRHPLRPERGDRARPDRAFPSAHGPLGAARRCGRDVLAWHEAENGHRARRAARAAHPLPRRADHGSRPRRREDRSRVHHRAARRGPHRLPVHAQPRRGRPALRSHRVLPPPRDPHRHGGPAARRALRARDRIPAAPLAARRGSRARPRGPGRARRALRERIDHRRDARSAAHESAPRARARGRRSADRVRHRAQAASRGRVPADRRGTGMTATSGPLLVGMTLLPPVVILAAGIVAVAAAAANPPSERDVQALYAAAPAVQGLDPTEAVQGFIATYFLILFMLIPTVVPLTMAIYSIIGEKSSRTLEPLLAAPVGVGELLFAKSLASTVPSVIVTWIAYAVYLVSVSALGSGAAVNAVTAPRWILAIVVMVPLLTLLSVNLGILISTRVNDV